MADKIQEELEKGCGRYVHLGLNPSFKCGEYHFICEVCMAKLAQHLATKQAMIKEFKDNLHFDCKCILCMKNKQKLGELK